MAFVTSFQGGAGPVTAYNIDFSVGPGAQGNLTEDIMLVQALFRILHFEVSDPLPPPPTDSSIEVDGILGPQTARFINNAQLLSKKAGVPVRLDGVFDPFRGLGVRSTIAHVNYVLELVNQGCRLRCRDDGIANYEGLPDRNDIPQELAIALSLPARAVAHKYEREPARA